MGRKNRIFGLKIRLKIGHHFTLISPIIFALSSKKIAIVSRETIWPQRENKNENQREKLARRQPVSVLLALIGGWTIQPDRLFSAQPIGRSGF